MKKKIIIAILLGFVFLGLSVLFPNKNKTVKIKEVNYATLFNDQNGVQLKAASRLGIKQPLKNREVADDVKDKLVHISAYSGDTRSLIPMISVHFISILLYRWQS